MGTAAAATVTAAVATTSTNKKYVLNFHAPNNERQVPKKKHIIYFLRSTRGIRKPSFSFKSINDWEKMQLHC